MKIIVALLFTISLSSNASECEISPDLLSAYYQLSTQPSNTTAIKKPVPQLFELHREAKVVLHRNISKGVDELWTKNGHRLSLSRVFEKYQHVIEYQSNELRYQPQWQDVFQLVVTPELKNMQFVEQKNTGCLLEEHYILKDKHKEYQLTWLPKLRLVKYFQLKDVKFTRQWQLTKYQPNDVERLSLFKQYSTYQSTDYADIGDSEDVPFLAKMINQGFSVPVHHHTGPVNNEHRH
ncbi:hypothetical protein [Colwellia sp. PAMC 21821]|uniref:hypothetical protein n=1 Tax=Colwellia sp. PAMC 21821 TaxID=1816219 RepID=UPI0009BDF06D|nr:hypothetical protein [Colwellia sp. PAMC 21821]ARD44657.1 hypothetical protein A3Q33_10240 [Colwellia sp. PAMC 21821]